MTDLNRELALVLRQEFDDLHMPDRLADINRRASRGRLLYAALGLIAVIALGVSGIWGLTQLREPTNNGVANPVPSVANPVPSSHEVLLAPLADLTVSEQDRASRVASRTLTASFGDPFGFNTAVIAFPRATVPIRCVNSVALRLHVGPGEPRGDASVSVYPSNVFNATDLRENDIVEAYGRLLDTMPKDELGVSPDQGSVEFDVTAIYKLWLSDEGFPSLGKRPPKDGPVVFALRSTTGAEPPFIRHFSSSESVTPPVLAIETKPDCS